MGRPFRPNAAPGPMRSVRRLLLVAALCCAGCDRGRHKGKVGAAEPGGGPVAVGKLIITLPLSEAARANGDEAGGGIEQQLDALGGAEIRRQAEDFLRKNHPDLKPVPVDIQVARVKGSNVVSVIGRGESPEYSGALVDALMEAYVTSVRPAEAKTVAGPGAETGDAEKALKAAERAWTVFRLEHDLPRLDLELSAAQRRQKRLGVAETYYEQELGLSAKLTLEQEIMRLQASPGLPPNMPAELAALVRTTLTAGEIAYLSALKGANAPAVEAARKEAEKDREDRARSLRKQKEIAGDLALTTAAEITRLQSVQKESERLQALHKAAEAAYAESKIREKNMDGRLNDSVHPVVSITERASRAGGG
jgi:hypothetical protein